MKKGKWMAWLYVFGGGHSYRDLLSDCLCHCGFLIYRFGSNSFC